MIHDSHKQSSYNFMDKADGSITCYVLCENCRYFLKRHGGGSPEMIYETGKDECRPFFLKRMLNAVYLSVKCTCDIRDIMSSGHNDGCPEKK